MTIVKVGKIELKNNNGKRENAKTKRGERGFNMEKKEGIGIKE